MAETEASTLPSWHFALRVYYEDTDAGGVVYYANYLKFAERARSDLLRAAALEPSRLMREHGLGFLVRRCACEYRQAAQLDDALIVETTSLSAQGARVRLLQEVLFAESGKLSARLHVDLALVNREKKPQRLPADLRKLFSRKI